MDIPFDINNTLDLIKLKFYNEWLYTAHIYDEGDSPFHKDLTTQIVTQYIDPLELPKDAHILDLGCGPGYAHALERAAAVATAVSAGAISLALSDDREASYLTSRSLKWSVIAQELEGCACRARKGTLS